jgi:hypothetical protein
MKKITIILAGAVVLLRVASAQAVFLDPYDNVMPADGLYTLLYGDVYTAGDLMGNDGKKVGRVDYTSALGIFRAIYYKHIGTVPLAFQIGIPFGSVEAKNPFADGKKERSSGVGDIFFSPGVFLYANENSKSYVAFWFYGYAPSGEFDQNNSYANMGWNHWYFLNQLALSQAFGKFILDANLNYYLHTKEDTWQMKAPDRFEIEYSLAYQATDKLVAGLCGGARWDLANYQYAGQGTSGSRGERFEIGPSIGYTITDKLNANFRWTHDVSTRNLPSGDEFWLRFGYSF